MLNTRNWLRSKYLKMRRINRQYVILRSPTDTRPEPVLELHRIQASAHVAMGAVPLRQIAHVRFLARAVRVKRTPEHLRVHLPCTDWPREGADRMSCVGVPLPIINAVRDPDVASFTVQQR